MEKDKPQTGNKDVPVFSPAFLAAEYAKTKGVEPQNIRRAHATRTNQGRAPTPSGIRKSLQDLMDGKPYQESSSYRKVAPSATPVIENREEDIPKLPSVSIHELNIAYGAVEGYQPKEKTINNNKKTEIMAKKHQEHMDRPIPPKEALRESERARIMQGDPDISKEVYLQVAVGVYFDIMKYERYKNKKVSYKDLIEAINRMGGYVLKGYLVSPSEAKIEAYLRTKSSRVSGKPLTESPESAGTPPATTVTDISVNNTDTDEAPETEDSAQPQNHRGKAPTRRSTLRKKVQNDFCQHGFLVSESIMQKIVPGSSAAISRVPDERLGELVIEQELFRKSLTEESPFKPESWIYFGSKNGNYLDIPAVIKAYRPVDDIDNDEKYAQVIEELYSIDVSGFILSEADIRKLAPERTDDDPPAEKDLKPVKKPKPVVESKGKRGRTTPLSELRAKRLQELQNLGIITEENPGFVLKIVPDCKTGARRLTDSALKRLTEKRVSFLLGLSKGKAFSPSDEIYLKTTEGNYLDLADIITAHRDINEPGEEGLAAIEAALKQDISKFVFAEEHITQKALELFPGNNTSGGTVKEKLPTDVKVVVKKLEFEVPAQTPSETITLICCPSDADYKLLANMLVNCIGDCLLKSETIAEKRYVEFSCIPNQREFEIIHSIFLRCQGNRELKIEAKLLT